MTTPVTIICPEHGEFQQSPRHHAINGHGCSKCYHESRRINHPKKILTLEEKAIIRRDKWIQECSIIHNNKYDYSKVEPIYNLKDKVIIICPEHGEFKQIAANHKLYGCAKCSHAVRAKTIMLSFEEFVNRANIIHNNHY